MTEVSTAELVAVLERGDVSLEGRLVQASNASFYGEACLDGVAVPCVYKPVRGERPLWDFPTGTLAGREVAAYEISRLAGWDVVPPTVMGSGPLGPGMVQQWVEEDPDAIMVDLVVGRQTPKGWLHVLDAVDEHDNLVSLVHADSAQLRSMAVFDSVVNNADRKGGHVLVGLDESVRGCDHGVTFHVEDKLRSVLWGWAGNPLADEDREALVELASQLGRTAVQARLAELLHSQEVAKLGHRVERLLRTGRHPRPSPGWPAIPWPAF